MPASTNWLTMPRLAGLAALGYVVGVSIENMEILEAATRDSPLAEIRATYSDQAFSIVALVAGALALVAYVAFVAALYLLLRERADPGERWPLAVLIGGVGGPMLAAAGLAASAILVFDIEATAAEDVDALYDFYLGARLASGAFVLLFMLAVGVSSLRSGALPRPLALLALAIAAPMALGPLAAATGSRALELVVAIAFAAQTLWIFLAGLWLVLGEGPRLALVRRSALLLLVIAASLIGIALLAVPGATGTFFAWGLGPEALAAFAGGIYVGAAAAYAAALPASARQARGLIAGAAVLSLSVFVISVTHSDQFDFDRLQAWIWMALFAAFSLIMLGLLAVESGAEGGPPPRRLPRWTRGVLAAVALAAAALALALWIDPTSLSDPWPYALPPLGGRFAGSWVALVAVVCGWAAVRDRPDEARLPALVLASISAGALIAALRTVDQLEPAGAAAAYVAVLAALAAVGLAVLLAATRAD